MGSFEQTFEVGDLCVRRGDGPVMQVIDVNRAFGIPSVTVLLVFDGEVVEADFSTVEMDRVVIPSEISRIKIEQAPPT